MVNSLNLKRGLHMSFCKNCGSMFLSENDNVCSNCGVPRGQGNSNFCPNCGASVTADQNHCTMCGYALKESTVAAAVTNAVNDAFSNNQATVTIEKDNGNKSMSATFTTPNTSPVYPAPVNPQPAANTAPKSKLAAGLLAIFLGAFGVHNFYLGYTKRAMIQLICSIVGIMTSCIIVGIFLLAGIGIWGLVEGIMILTGSINTDANGVQLTE